MGKGSKVVVINGIWHGKHGTIVDVLPDGNLRCEFPVRVYIGMELCDGITTVEVKPHDVELEEREDLYKDLI